MRDRMNLAWRTVKVTGDHFYAKLSTTQKYLNVIPVELKRAHTAAHPSEHQRLPAAVTPKRVTRSKWDRLRKREE